MKIIPNWFKTLSNPYYEAKDIISSGASYNPGEIKESEEFKEKIDFLSGLGENYWESLHQARIILEKKSALLLSYLLLVCSFLITKELNLISNLTRMNFHLSMAVAFLTTLYLALAAWVFKFGLSPKPEAIFGEEPRVVIESNFFNNDMSEILLAMSVMLQKKINVNGSINSAFSKYLSKSFYFVLAIPIMATIFFFTTFI